MSNFKSPVQFHWISLLFYIFCLGLCRQTDHLSQLRNILKPKSFSFKHARFVKVLICIFGKDCL